MLKDIEEFEMKNYATVKKKIDPLQKRTHKSYIDKKELEPTPKIDLDRTLEMCTVATKKAPEDAFSKNGADDGVRTHVYRNHNPRP